MQLSELNLKIKLSELNYGATKVTFGIHKKFLDNKFQKAAQK